MLDPQKSDAGEIIGDVVDARPQHRLFDFRALLLEELELRQKKNPRYSARAFARDLKVVPSFWIALIKGDKVPTEERALEMARELKWGAKKMRFFGSLVRLARTKSEAGRLEILREVEKLEAAASPAWRLSLDHFRIVSDWYHFAIVELLDLAGPEPSSDDIARRFGLPTATIREALTRLESVGLIKRAKGRLVKSHDNYVIEDIPSEAIREHHRQILDLGKSALKSQTPDEREFSSTVFTVDPRMIPEIKERIRVFRAEIEALAAKSSDRTELLELAIQAFRL